MVKLTKNELREQQNLLSQLTRYLPTLQLKKAMLQVQLSEARAEIAKYEQQFTEEFQKAQPIWPLLQQQAGVDPMEVVKISELVKTYENVAGVEIPRLEKLEFAPLDYTFYDTESWLEAAIDRLHQLLWVKAQVDVAREKWNAIEKELREVSIRVNLFEKVLIPRAKAALRKISIFLSDQQMAAVARAKVAKKKVLEKREMSECVET